MAEWLHYSTPDPEYARLLATMPPPQDLDVPGRRALVAERDRKRLASAEYPTTSLDISERLLPVDGGEIKLRIYTPESSDAGERFPILVDLHGGGYMHGSLDTDDIKCRYACVEHRLVVVNVDYRLAPEHPYPAGLNDSIAAVKWTVLNAPALRGAPARGFILNGLSAGANFTCAITQLARTDPVLAGVISGQVLQVPATCAGGAGIFPEKYKHRLLSYEQNKDDYVLNRVNLRLYMDAYKQGPADDPVVSPLLAESFAALPPAYLQIAGGDPLRDEGLLYAQLLEEGGVPTRVDVYPGLPHGFSSYFPQLGAALKWKRDFDEGLKWLLSFSAT